MGPFQQLTFMKDRHRHTAMRLSGRAGLIGVVLAALLVAPYSTAGEPTGTASILAPPESSAASVKPGAEDPAVVTVPGPPQLSITIDNGQTVATTGDKLDYVITVQNLATADIDGLRVNQSLPTGMEFSTADSGGTADAGYVTWTVDLKATTTATFHTTMTVAATPAELLRLASVACASISPDSPPIVCASHSDQLPAGAAAEAAQVAMVVTPGSQSQPWWYVLAGFAVFVGLGGSAAWWVIRKRRRSAAAETDALALTR